MWKIGYMDRTNIKKIIAECKEYPGIIAAYLFGSQLTGKKRSDSDIDVAILLYEANRERFPYLDFKVDLERNLHKDVDLIILNKAGEVLKYQVRRYGNLIYEKDPVLRKQWEILSRKLYQDFLHLHRIYMRSLYNHYGVMDG